MHSIVSRVRLIRDCIIYDERGELKEENINFERILRFVGDWTGYEVSCSEIRFSRESIPKEQLMDFMRKIRDGLSQIIHGEKVVVLPKRLRFSSCGSKKVSFFVFFCSK